MTAMCLSKAENRFCWCKVDHRGRASVPLPLIFPLFVLETRQCVNTSRALVLECETCPVHYPWSGMWILHSVTHDSTCLSFIRQQRAAAVTDPSNFLKGIFKDNFILSWNGEEVVLQDTVLLYQCFLNQDQDSASCTTYCTFAGTLNEKDVYQPLLSYTALTLLFCGGHHSLSTG